jgi:hypothetical protein
LWIFSRDHGICKVRSITFLQQKLKYGGHELA